MKNEKILECVKRLENALDAEQRAKYDFLLKYINSGDLCAADLKNGDSIAAAVAYLRVNLTHCISTEEARKNNTTAIKKTLENVCKTAAKIGGAAVRFAKCADLDGCQVVCDGFRLFRLNRSIGLAPEYMNGDAENYKSLVNRIIAQATKNAESLPIPEPCELDAFIKEGKAARKLHKDKSALMWDFGDGLPAVNAEYLRDVLTVYGADVKLYSNGFINPIYIISDAGDGVICPIKKAARATA